MENSSLKCDEVIKTMNSGTSSEDNVPLGGGDDSDVTELNVNVRIVVSESEIDVNVCR
jgi:hypothetical protein